MVRGGVEERGAGGIGKLREQLRGEAAGLGVGEGAQRRGDGRFLRGREEVRERMEVGTEISGLRRGGCQRLDARAQRIDGAFAFALAVTQLLEALIGGIGFRSGAHVGFFEGLAFRIEGRQLIRDAVGLALGGLRALTGGTEGLLVAGELGFDGLDLSSKRLLRGNKTDNALPAVRNGAQLGHVFAVGGLEGLPFLQQGFAQGLQAHGGFLCRFEEHLVFLVGTRSAGLKILGILAGVGDLGADVLGALGGDALGRRDALDERGQIEPQLLGGIGSRCRDGELGLDVGVGFFCSFELSLERGDLFSEELGLFLRVVVFGAQAHDLIAGETQAGVAQIRLDRGGALRGFRLSREGLELLAQLIREVLEAIQVRLHAGELALRLFFAAAVLEDAGRLFYIGTAVPRTRLKDLRELALPDDNVHLAADTGVAEQLLNIHEAGFGTINFIFTRAVAVHAAGDGDLGVLDGQRTIRVVDGERHLGATQGLAVTRTGEDDVLHLAATQRFGGALPHDPREGIDDIGFAGAVGTNHGADAGLKFHRRRRREGLESFERERFEVHSCNSSKPCARPRYKYFLILN